MKEYFSKNKTRNLYARRDALPSQCDHRKLVGEVLSAERLKFCLKARWQHQLHSSRKFLNYFILPESRRILYMVQYFLLASALRQLVLGSTLGKLLPCSY